MSKKQPPDQTSRDYSLRMKELSKDILLTRKSLWASKKRVDSIEKERADGKRKSGCSGCLKNGVNIMTMRLAQLRETQGKLKKGEIAPDDIHKVQAAGMAKRRAEKVSSKRRSSPGDAIMAQLKAKRRVIIANKRDAKNKIPRGRDFIKGNRNP